MATLKNHHSVYVIELGPGAKRSGAKPGPALYVGMTGLPIEQRFENHRAGYKSSGVVKRFGSHLRPDLYEHLNPMTWEAAAAMEKQLAADLRRRGAEVFGGH